MVEGGEKQNAGVKVKTKVMVFPQRVGRRRFISARQIVIKNSSRTMKGEEIYYRQTEGEDDLCHTGVRCNVMDVQVSTGQKRRTWFQSVICKRLLVRAASMDPLAVVEAQLGSVDSWPSYVLRYMFCWYLIHM